MNEGKMYLETVVKPVSIQKRALEKGKSSELGELFDKAHLLEENISNRFNLPYNKDGRNDVFMNPFVSRELIDIALKAREFAQSHRNFNVGVAMLGVAKTDDNSLEWRVLFDANTKDLQNGVVRKCGEQYIMDRLEDEKIVRVLGFVIVADVQPDDTSGKPAMTLMPCKSCRHSFEEYASGGVSPISADTAVLSVDAQDLWIQKLQTVRSLHEFHGESFIENF